MRRRSNAAGCIFIMVGIAASAQQYGAENAAKYPRLVLLFVRDGGEIASKSKAVPGQDLRRHKSKAVASGGYIATQQ